MKSDREICPFPGCGYPAEWNNHCKGHAKQLADGRDLKPIRRRGTKSTERGCDFPECEEPHYGKGLCNAHWQQSKKGRDLTPVDGGMPMDGECLLEGCNRKRAVRGICFTHYRMKRDTGEYGDIGPWTSVKGKRCIVPECGEDAFSKMLCRKHVKLKIYFNLSDDKIARLYEGGGRCQICGATSSGKRGLHVDHDHSCCPEPGRSCGDCVRGLLCVRCNQGIGNFREDVEIMQNAISYVQVGGRL